MNAYPHPGERFFAAIASREILFLGLLLEIAAPLAAANSWTGLGPPGSEVTALAAVPGSSVLYAGTKYGGVFKSTNGGSTWVASNAGLGAPWVLSLAVDPTSPSTIYAGLQSESPNPGLFKSTDGGATWVARGPSYAVNNFASVYSLAIDTANPTVVYAGSAQVIFKSPDGGSSWSIAKDFHTANVAYLALDPSQPSTLYASGPTDPFPVGCGGLWKSIDSGATWTFLSNFPNTAAQAIVVDPTNSASLYTANVGCSGTGVYQSTDGGGTWASRSSGLPGGVLSLTMDPGDHATLYAGGDPGAGSNSETVFKTSNGGGVWAPVNQSGLPADFVVPALVAMPSSIVYAGGWIDRNDSLFNPGGIFKSVNAGDSWSSARAGFTNTFAHDIAIDPSNPSILYAALEGENSNTKGVSKSVDRGASWNPMSTGMVSGVLPGLPAVQKITIDPTNPSILYCATDFGVFRSSDGATSWSAINSGLGFNPIIASVVVDPATPSTLYLINQGSAGGIYRTTNSGANWVPSTSAFAALTLAIDANNPSTIYAAASSIYKSTDGGGNWSLLSSYPGGQTRTFVITPVSSTLYAGGDQHGIFKSSDGGHAWTQVVNGLTNLYVKSLAVDPIDENILYAGADQNSFVSGAVFRTADGGSSWAVMTTIPPDFVQALAAGPSNSRFLYAATYGSGIQAICLPPTLSAGSNGPICAGHTLQLVAPTIAGATYGWTGPNGFTSSLQNPAIPSASTAASGVYTVTATVGFCVSDPATTSVTVNAQPAAPEVTTSSTIIGAGSPNRTANVPPHTGSTYAWAIENGTITSGQGTSQIVFTGGMAGTPLTLSVTETNASGCMSTPGNAAVTVAPAGSAVLFYALPPCRILDTRIQTGPLNAPSLQPDATRTFDVAASPCNVPAGAVAISANLTVTNVGAPGELIVFPSDVLRPNTTAISFRSGRTRANNEIVSFSKSSETFSVFNNSAATVDFILDVNGYFQ